MVTMHIDDNGLPLHSDARLKIRPRIFLEGNYFVDLEPGSPSAKKLEDGDTVPVTQTAAPVGLGRVLEALQRDTREDLKTVLEEYGKALAKGGAKGYNRSTVYWTRGLPRLGDRQRRDARHPRARPRQLHPRLGHRRRRAGQGPSRAEGPDHRLRDHRRRVGA